MRTYELPYGKTPLTFEAPDWLTLEQPEAHAVPAAAGEAELVRAAMEHPIGSPRLRELAVGKNKVVIIASDHTRPVPSKFLIPPMLEEIRTGNPEADITILVATGCHRETTVEELRDKFGDEIVEQERKIAATGARVASGGKDHLTKTAGRGTPAIEVPKDVKESYRMLNPGMTDADIEKAYQKFMGRK